MTLNAVQHPNEIQLPGDGNLISDSDGRASRAFADTNGDSRMWLQPVMVLYIELLGPSYKGR